MSITIPIFSQRNWDFEDVELSGTVTSSPYNPVRFVGDFDFGIGSSVDFTGVIVTGLAVSLNDATLTGTTTVSDILHIVGATTIDSTLTTNGLVTAGAGLSIPGGYDITQTGLGDVVFSGSFVFPAGTSVDFSGATVTGLSLTFNNVTLTGTTNVSGSLNITGATAIASTLDANGLLTASAGISTTSLSASTTIIAAGLISANGGLSSTTINASGLVTASAGVSTTTLTASSTIIASAGMNIPGGQSITQTGPGAVHFAGAFDFTAGATIDFSNAVITLPASIFNNATFTGTTAVSGPLNVAGATTISNTLAVTAGGVSTTSLSASTTITAAGLISANGGLSATTINASGLVTASAGLATTTVSASSTITANGVITASAGLSIPSGQSITRTGVGAVHFAGEFDFSAGASIDFTDAAITGITTLSGLTLTGTTTVSGPVNIGAGSLLTAAGGIVATTITASGLISANGGLTSTTIAASGLITASAGLSATTLFASSTLLVTGLITASAGLAIPGGQSITQTGPGTVHLAGAFDFTAGATIDFANAVVSNLSASLNNATLTGTTTVSGPMNIGAGSLLTASGGISTTTLIASGLVTASGGISTTSVSASTTIAATGLISANGGLSATTINASGLVTASAGISTTSVSASTTIAATGLISANGGLSATTINTTGAVTASGGLNIPGGQSITQTGPGAVHFAGAFDFTAGATIDFANAVVSNLSVTLNNATLTGTTTVSGPVNIGAGSLLTTSGGISTTTLIASGLVTASGGLDIPGGQSITQTGPGAVHFAGAFDFTAGATIDFANAVVSNLSVTLNNATLTGTTTITGPVDASTVKVTVNNLTVQQLASAPTFPASTYTIWAGTTGSLRANTTWMPLEISATTPSAGLLVYFGTNGLLNSGLSTVIPATLPRPLTLTVPAFGSGDTIGVIVTSAATTASTVIDIINTTAGNNSAGLRIGAPFVAGTSNTWILKSDPSAAGLDSFTIAQKGTTYLNINVNSLYTQFGTPGVRVSGLSLLGSAGSNPVVDVTYGPRTLWFDTSTSLFMAAANPLAVQQTAATTITQSGALFGVPIAVITNIYKIGRHCMVTIPAFDFQSPTTGLANAQFLLTFDAGTPANCLPPDGAVVEVPGFQIVSAVGVGGAFTVSPGALRFDLANKRFIAVSPRILNLSGVGNSSVQARKEQWTLAVGESVYMSTGYNGGVVGSGANISYISAS
jgi:hypothetical protein